MQQMIEWIKEQRGEGGSKGDRGEDWYDEIKAKLMIRTVESIGGGGGGGGGW